MMQNNFKIQIDTYEEFDQACRSAVKHWCALPQNLQVDAVRAWYQWAANAHPKWFIKWILMKPNFPDRI